MKGRNIEKLIEKFFDGQTTLAEERRLYAYFRSRDVADGLAHYRPLFAGFASLPEPRHRVGHIPLRRLVAGIAASILLLAGSYTAWLLYENRQLDMRYGGSYMIVDGRRIDNLREIKPHIERTLAAARHIEQTVAAQPTVADMERELMGHISDPEERARIKQLLN